MKSSVSERALILAPHGRDAVVARAMLSESGLGADVVAHVDMLVAELTAGAGFALVTEEAFDGVNLRGLSDWIEDQPEWSDFPFILLTQRGGGLERNPSASRHLDVLGNVTFLERPFHPTTLVSLAKSAVRGRRRQYEARARLEELNLLAADLERRVEERTAEHAVAVAQLHEAQKLETLGQLTGGVAHDFNNLLTPITGALDLLQRRYADSDPRSARLLSNALKSADRAKILVQRLLGFARRQSLDTRAVDVAGLLAGMRDLIASSVGPTIELHVKCKSSLSPALADANQLELALLNLCMNARDAMPDGGPLTIMAEEVAIGPASEPTLKPGLYVRLSVIDAGSGMSPDTLARAVEPFFSTKEVGRGTGLGLSMVHGLAAQLGGGFAMSSEVGQGTRVDLYLPAADADGISERASPRLSVRPMDRSLSVLLVDDEDLVRNATAEMIRDLGHDVSDASDGEEALAKLAERSFDVVITDYKMPRMDGAQLAQQVHDRHAGTAVLVITGYTGISAEDLPVLKLAKPFGQAEISAALAALFAGDENILPFPDRKRAGPSGGGGKK